MNTHSEIAKLKEAVTLLFNANVLVNEVLSTMRERRDESLTPSDVALRCGIGHLASVEDAIDDVGCNLEQFIESE